MAEAIDDWTPARLIPVVGIRGQEEQEGRATSALLAVMAAVPDFGHALLRDLGPPRGSPAIDVDLDEPVAEDDLSKIDGPDPRRQPMAPIIASVEVSRRPEDVFAYITDPSHLPEWQESVVRVKTEASAPTGGGSRSVITRRIGPREIDMTTDIADLDPPRSWRVRGVDGPVRGNVKGTIEPLDGGARSRVTLELDLEGHGIGKLLVPLVARRQAQKELPVNVQKLKERLESAAV